MNTLAIPTTMNSLVLRGLRDVGVEAITVPSPTDGELLLQIRAATTCGTDLKAFLRGHPQIPMPGKFGHEYSGVVVSTGGNTKFAVGDEVMGVHSAPCKKCFWCLRDQENLCESIMESKVLGSYAEYLLIPKRIADINLFEKPKDLPFEEASLLEPLSCVAQGMLEIKKHQDISPEAKVLVIGPGAIGMMFAVALKSTGISNVVLAGRNSQRLQIATEMGIQTVQFSELNQKDQFDVVIECTGSKLVWESAPNFARRGGLVVLFGGLPSGTQVSFDAGALHYRQIDLISPFHFGTSAVQLAYGWLSSGSVRLAGLISGTAKLEEADQVFQMLEHGQGLKFAFTP